MNEFVLEGCTSTPLASYLKALGVLRLVSAADDGARGWWKGRTFVLGTSLAETDLEDLFLYRYEPSPVMAPWNGGSGFYAKDNKDALLAIESSSSPRLATYRRCLEIAETAMAATDRDASAKDDAKVALLSRLRSLLPDIALDWLDAAVVLTGESLRYPPLLGTGGNDGRLDFTNNFMQRLLEVLPDDGEQASETSRRWLATALRGGPAPGLVKKAVGQFAPGQVGGPNATAGFTSESLVNPWDFVLMIEGLLPFASAVVRRNANDPAGVLSYPFTVRAVGAGAGSLGEGDAGAARGEVWMPLWQRPATFGEVRALLAEGRVALGRKPARDALDFVRAVHRLGAYRGIQRFERYGLLMRSGKAYLATPLSQVAVGQHVETPWLDDLDRDGWLDRFRRFAQGDAVATRFKMLRKRLEDALFDLAGRPPSSADAQALLLLLSDVQATLSASRKAKEKEGGIRPVPRLSEGWVRAAADGTPAFRIALAIAGLGGRADRALAIQAQVFPVHPIRNEWSEGADETTRRLRLHTEARGRLPETLVALLRRRLWLGEQMDLPDRPLDSPAGIDLDDLAAFLGSSDHDARVASLFPALSLCRVPDDDVQVAGRARIPAGFALLRTCLLSETTLRNVGVLPDGKRLPTATGLVAKLATGNPGNRAVQLAWRRLRASGLSPLPSGNALPGLGGIDPARAAAALLIPLRFGAAAVLARSVLRDNEHDVA